ncbi:hypothetical protein [Pelodictyon phaeoclathratiforme]|uniref:hypothetical protein n=1 Tax=Pelodictyon phaeoclathratiforme TaxID=34090 RepID=UPI0000543CCB|nr:hypothetical protein [Pelodictyon phaeoclathratiforme]MBV5290646.1 hypothetical protein [Pelodictyon phaeoclathratiforme]
MLTQLHVTLVKLSLQLTALVSVEDFDEISFFYEPTIGYFAEKRKQISYLPSPDEQTMDLSRTFRNTVCKNRRRVRRIAAKHSDFFSKKYLQQRLMI